MSTWGAQAIVTVGKTYLGETQFSVRLSIETLRKHRLHEGVYQRVAKRLGVDASYVNKVASGKLSSPEIHRALLDELQRIERVRATKTSALFAKGAGSLFEV